VLLATPDKFDRGAQVARLWRNECLRVFHDRLITVEDRTYVKDNLVGSLVSQMWRNEAKEINAEPILFGDYRHAQTEGEPRLYEDLESYATVRTVFDAVLETLNESGARGGQRDGSIIVNVSNHCLFSPTNSA
jgi:dynein heavy chain